MSDYQYYDLFDMDPDDMSVIFNDAVRAGEFQKAADIFAIYSKQLNI